MFPVCYQLLERNSENGVVQKITNTVSKDVRPVAADEDTFYYLSDQRGIVNLFKYKLSTGIYSQVTNFNTSIEEYDVNFPENKLAVVMSKNMAREIFLLNNYNYSRQVFTPSTRRKEVQQVKALTEKRKEEEPKGMSIKELINSRLRAKSDTINISLPPKQEVPKDTTKLKNDTLKRDSVNTDDYQFEEEVPAKVVTPPVVTKTEEPKPEKVNTDDYTFEDEAVKSKQPSETFLTRYLKARDNSRITGPFPYEPKFNYNNLVTNMVIDPIRSYSLRIETQMNDMLENYRFMGGIQTAFDWKSGDVYGEIQYLPHRVDYSIRVDRKVIFWDQRDISDASAEPRYLQKYSLQKVEFGAALPLTVRTRVTVKPFLAYTRFVDRGPDNMVPATPPTFLPTVDQYYGGAKAELVYDNSITTGINLIEGTRGKIVFTHYEGFGNKNASFSNLSADVRHYQKIYKEIVFAVRGFAGTFFGRSPKQYALGGMDNWFGTHINPSGIGNPLASVSNRFNGNLLFTEFATNLRGFDYATLYGNNVLMANVELRVPLIRALAGGPVTSNFFRNMQFVGFYDIGTSWSGPPPFNSGGSVRQKQIKSGEITVQLNEYLNPWLYSYGVGLRTVMLGYYLKFDLAWPVENFRVHDPRLMVTLGYDF